MATSVHEFVSDLSRSPSMKNKFMEMLAELREGAVRNLLKASDDQLAARRAVVVEYDNLIKSINFIDTEPQNVEA